MYSQQVRMHIWMAAHEDEDHIGKRPTHNPQTLSSPTPPSSPTLPPSNSALIIPNNVFFHRCRSA